jgi:pSer/pThr/pTyr-binding forkhead associated (FHA) protein
LIGDGREIALREGETIIGRDHLAGIRIPSESISRQHARIVVSESAATLEDLGSKNGTYLRGERIGESKALEDGDSIRLGSVTLTLRVVSGEGSTATEIGPSPAGEVSLPASPRLASPKREARTPRVREVSSPVPRPRRGKREIP